jgi:hypothetical protein
LNESNVSRKVKTTAGVRQCIKDFGVPKFCEQKKLLPQYQSAIAQTITGWSELLSLDRVDEVVITNLTEVLEAETWIEDDLRDRFELPDGWGQQDENWARYRTAIAVRILQAYYDSIP